MSAMKRSLHLWVLTFAAPSADSTLFFFIVEVARLTAVFGMVAICAVVPAQYLLVTRSHLQFVTMIEDAECWKDNGIATFIRDGRCSCSIQRIKSEHNSSNFLFISSDCGEGETAATPYEGWEFEASRIRSAIVAKTSRVPLLAAKIFLTIDGISCKKSDFKKGSATDCPAKALISLRSTVGQQSPSPWCYHTECPKTVGRCLKFGWPIQDSMPWGRGVILSSGPGHEVGRIELLAVRTRHWHLFARMVEPLFQYETQYLARKSCHSR